MVMEVRSELGSVMWEMLVRRTMVIEVESAEAVVMEVRSMMLAGEVGDDGSDGRWCWRCGLAMMMAARWSSGYGGDGAAVEVRW
ncbi:hypothetical protein F0562_005657 [Nyssa sinensis]|uniref:Uncharacterized protein n=1 Tax=Nyssa sinensis TaxID=561372 RepID=A0A5J5AMS2_9ASTE|nr:hypothetical protein F0562_005657 [Nyssa sinensis]